MTPETQNVEWKRSWRDEYLAWICGFANAQGGVLCLRFPFSEAYLEAAGGGGSADRGTTPITTPITPITTPIAIPKTSRSTEPIPVEDRILALLEAEPGITQAAIAERIGLTVDGVKYHFRKLREAGAIRRVGPSRTGHWEVL